MSASRLLILVVGANMGRQQLCTDPSLWLSLVLHVDPTLLQQSERGPAWLGRRHKSSHSLVGGNLWLHGLNGALLTFDPWGVASSELSSVWLWEGSGASEYSIVPSTNPWVWKFHGNITVCGMDRVRLHLVLAAAPLHLMQQYRAHSLVCSYPLCITAYCDSHTPHVRVVDSIVTTSATWTYSVHHHMDSAIKHGRNRVTWRDGSLKIAKREWDMEYRIQNTGFS